MSTSHFQTGDSPRYINEGHNEMVELVDTNNNNPKNANYIIKLLGSNTCFTTYLKEGPGKTPRHVPSTVLNSENKNNILVSSLTKPHVNEDTSIKVTCTYGLHKRPVNKEVQNKYGYKRNHHTHQESQIKKFECQVNANFAHNWVQTNTDDAENFRLRSVFIFIWIEVRK